MAGDHVDIKAKAFYNASGTSTGQVSNANMLTSILSTLNGNIVESGAIEGGQVQEIINGSFTPSNYVDAYSALKNESTNPNKPKAYLNYLVFDENLRLVKTNSGSVQPCEGNSWETLDVEGGLLMDKSGYVAIFLSNEEHSWPVFFDELEVNLVPGKLLAEYHYYPMGMAVREGQSSYATPNDKLYQSKKLHSTILNAAVTTQP
jgi:hypothetical protein